MTKPAPAIELAAPAKLNLSLRVLRRREDGFHEIETRMVPMPSVCDQVRVELLPESEPGYVDLLCDAPEVPTDDSNLAVGAVRKLELACCRRLAAMRITLAKNIPSGAGLGGGSSDAAAVLLAVNELQDLGLSRERLAEIAAGVGSDVPFFVYGRACDCSGRGEIVVPLQDHAIPVLPEVLLVKPPFGVETPSAYKRWADSREIPSVRYEPQSTEAGVLINDLERPVFEKFPFLAELKMWLLDRPEVTAALMSGSGATVFAFLRTDAGETLEDDVRRHFGADMWMARSSHFSAGFS